MEAVLAIEIMEESQSNLGGKVNPSILKNGFPSRTDASRRIPSYSLQWSVKKGSSFYVIFGQKRTKLLAFLSKYHSYTVMGKFFIMTGVVAVNQSL